MIKKARYCKEFYLVLVLIWLAYGGWGCSTGRATGKEIPRAEGEAEEHFSAERPPRRDRERGGDRGRGERRRRE